MTQLSDSALYYANRLVWPVFAIPPRQKKPPEGSHGFKDATLNPQQIAEWWSREPEANIGIPGGPETFLALDVDPRHDGDQTLADLEARFGKLPHTVEAITGSGGRHILFQYPNHGTKIGNSKGRLDDFGPGLDIRGDGGYIVVAPSVHPCGKCYEWEVSSRPGEVPLAEAPSWLIAILTDPGHKEAPPIVGDILEGARNAALTSLAGTMRRRGMLEASILQALLIENDTRCRPPLPEREVHNIAKSIENYAPADPISPTRDGTIQERPLISITAAAADVMEQIKVRAADPRDVWGIPYGDYPYLSKLTGGKQTGELIILAGEPKVGKSWWAMQDALFTATHNIPVLYWSGEMRARQLMRRFYQQLGLDAYRMRTGRMTSTDWQILDEASGFIKSVPLFIDDEPLKLSDLKPMLQRAIGQYGVRQVIFDYAMKIFTDGRDDEIAQTSKVSWEIKTLCTQLDISAVLVASVNKQGMDGRGAVGLKSAVRGSGQQIHDADVVYTLTRYTPLSETSKPGADKIVTLHISAARDFDPTLTGGIIHYERMGDTPRYREMK